MRQTTLALSGAAFLLISCGGGDSTSPPPPPPPPPSVAAVTVEPGTPSVQAGGTVQLTATARDAAGNALSGRTITWASQNEPVATVSGTGLVTAVTAGTAEVRATSEGRTGAANVTVTPVPVATVTLSATEGTLVPAQTLTLVATAKDAAGRTLNGRTVAWSTSAAGTATVSNAGVVSAVAAGNATITATVEGKTATAAITVLDGGLIPAGGGVVNAAGGNVSVTVPAGALAGATVITVAAMEAPPPDAALVASTAYDFGPSGTQFDQPVTLRIKYAAVDVPAGADQTLFRIYSLDNGTWTPVPGSTVDVPTRTVTGTTTHFSGYAIGRLAPPVNNVTVTPALTLLVGSEGQLTATLKDALGNTLSGRPVTWSSLHPAIATVSQTGAVQAAAVGAATITATSEGKSGQVTVTVVAPTGFTLGKLSTSGATTCGLTTAGEAWCWGRNGSGEVGDGSRTMRTRPVRVSTNQTFSAIAAGGVFSCGLNTAGKAYCWGDNTFGSLGTGNNTSSTVPVPVETSLSFSSIAAGAWHACASTASGQAWCWGLGSSGALGDNGTTNRNSPVQVSGGHSFGQLTAGTYHTCGIIQSGHAYCWGDNGAFTLSGVTTAPGILGVGSLTTTISQPMQVVGPISQWADISAGLGFTCARTPGGVVHCWGVNSYGNLGDGSRILRTGPTPVATGLTFASIASGGFHSCARSMTNEAWCWGRNTLAQIGDDSHTDRLSPVMAASGAVRFAHVTVGASTSCGLSTAGDSWCWGYGGVGSIGDGTTTDRPTPVKSTP